MRLEPMGLPGRCTFFRLTPTTGARVWVVQCVAAGGKVVVVRVTMRWNVASRMRCVRIHPKSAAFLVYTGSSSAACRATDGFLRRTAKTKATRPVPRRSRELGSGAVPVSPPLPMNVGMPPPTGTVRPPLKPLLPTPPVPAPQPLPMVFVSMVTAPVFAKALPQPIVALLFRVMLASARIFPWKEVVVSRVAELPTFQNTPAPEPVLITFTTEPGEVMSVLGIWNTHAALALPRPLRVSVPVKLLTPAGTV